MDNPSATGQPDGEGRKTLRGPFGGKAIYVGRILGIDIGLDYSWLIVFALVTYALGSEFTREHAQWPAGLVWLTAVVTSLLFFGSILLHELGHSVTSNALGLPIHSIVLFIFGGVARLTREPDRPRDEFLIAVAGPLVSLGLAGLFLALSFLPGSETAGGQALDAMFQRVGVINIAVLIFNCIPGFPLDGGRIFRSFVWAVTGSYRKATRLAAAGGAAFAYVLIIGGISLSVFGGLPWFNGLWMAFIGWFLLTAARSSVTQMVFQESLSRIRVEEVFERDCVRVSGSMSVAHLIEGPILRQGHRTFFIEREGRLVGLVTLQEVKRVSEDEREITPLQAIAAPMDSLHSLGPDDILWAALRKMDETGVNQLPVVRDGILLGVLTRESLLRVVRNYLELGGR